MSLTPAFDRTEQVNPIDLRPGDSVDVLPLLDSPDAHLWTWHPLGDDGRARNEILKDARQAAETEMAVVNSVERGGGGMVIVYTTQGNLSVTASRPIARAA